MIGVLAPAGLGPVWRLAVPVFYRKRRGRGAFGGIMRALVSTLKIVCLVLGLCVAGVALVGILGGKALGLLAAGLQSLSGLEFS